MNDIKLSLRNITKRFPGVVALSDVSLDLHKGEILGLVGENGAGKSTLMQVLSGVYPEGTYEGSIYIDGQERTFRRPKDSERAGIAMIYQEISMHLDMSLLENLFLGAWETDSGRRIRWKSMEKRARELLDIVGLDLDPRRKLRTLSKTQQQMVSIARALDRQPEILIMDEPTSSLTLAEIDTLFSVVHSLRERGLSIILISHKLDEVFANCDRITVLRNGETVATHQTAETHMDQIVTNMVGRKLTALYPKESVPIGKEILRVEDFTVHHPFNADKNILKDVSFSLQAGEILGIEGLVGSGRTELVQAIFGIGGRVAGKVFLEGSESSIKHPSDAIAYGMAMVTEDRREDGFVGIHALGPNISLANLKKVSKGGHLRKGIEQGIVAEYIKLLKIKTGSSMTSVRNLSGGNQQKVVISKWLNTHPKVLIMDEPTRGIDVGAKSEIYRIMVDLARSGMGIIMISSERSELLAMADRLIVLGRGRVQGELERSQFDEGTIVSMAMGRRVP